jgi:hypothetical protein
VLKEDLAEHKESTRKEVERLRQIARDQGVTIRNELNETKERLDRHRRDLDHLRRKVREVRAERDSDREEVNDLEAEMVILKAQVTSMEGRLCRCGEASLAWSGEGTAAAPLELDDEEGSQGSYHSASSSSFSAENPAVIQVSTVVETSPARLVPIEELEVEVVGTPREQEVREASRELVRRPRMRVPRMTSSILSRQLRVANRMSTAVPPKFPPRRPNPDYHLGVNHRLRQNIRRAGRGLGGYESSSESGTSGLSDDSEYEDYHHAPRLGTSCSHSPGAGFNQLDEAGDVGSAGRGGGGCLVVRIPPCTHGES